MIAWISLALLASVDPDGVRARLAAAGDAARYDADVVIVLDETTVNVRPNGIGEATHHTLTKVLRDAGARAQAVQRFNFDPDTNRFTLRAVRVHRGDGRVEAVDVSAATVQPEPQWGIYWANQRVTLAMPRLEVGDAVEATYTKIGFNVAYLDDAAGEGAAPGAAAEGGELQPPMPGHWYDEVSFWSGVPVMEKRYTVRVPRDKPLQYAVYNGEVRSSLTLEGDVTVYSFEKHDIPAFRGEPNMPSARDTECKLVLATLEDWPRKSRWFHAANEAQFERDESIRAVTRSVIAGCADDEAKITALNHWVAENIRYVGTSRGACEGYTTHRAAETLRDRGGVCKDKAGLLVAMLREAGFDAYIVMTQAGSEVTPVPADQFNHAVTCIRTADGAFRLLDPTWMPKSRENWSSAEQLQHVVYGTPEGQPLSRSPYSGPENNWVRWDASSSLSADGSLRGELALSAAGVPETNLRRSLNGRRPGERPRAMAEWLARLACDARLTAFDAMDPMDFSGPFTLRCGYAAGAFAWGAHERRYLPLPMLRRIASEVVLSDLPAEVAEGRRYPVRMRSTRRIDIRESLTLPPGWKLVDRPGAVALDGVAASLNFELRETGGRIEYTCLADFKKHVVPVAECGELKRVVDALNDLARAWLVLELETRSAGATALDTGTR